MFRKGVNSRGRASSVGMFDKFNVVKREKMDKK